MKLEYDIIVVGGGLAGAVAARKLAETGRRILVLERETSFRDRVRGEQMHPWGGAVARRLGIRDELLASRCGHDARFNNVYVMGHQTSHRDLHATTPYGGIGVTTFHHPEMQELFLTAAGAAGATVRRGAGVLSIAGGESPLVTFTDTAGTHSASARIVIGADGRTSKVRTWAGFETHRDPERLRIAGALLHRTPAPIDGLHMCVAPQGNMLLCPLGDGRARAYFIYDIGVAGRRGLSGKDQVDEFLRSCRATGAPAEWLDGVMLAPPLADFEGAAQWVEHPYRDGIVLVGDAAATLDPSFGAGLSKVLLDIEHLLEALGSSDDRDTALAAYAASHDRHYRILHDLEAWLTTLLWSRGPAADERRHRVMPRFDIGDPALPDLQLGPDGPHDPAARRLMLGE
jgi:2-polyprenyl-6-methoxyphenol hydroxylase-like FAD-dependent oxidoreductase